MVLTGKSTIDIDDLPPGLQDEASGGAPANMEVFSLAHLPYAEAKRLALRAFERSYLSTLLRRANYNVSSAARAAGVDRSNFRRLLKQYEVEGAKKDDDDKNGGQLEGAA